MANVFEEHKDVGCWVAITENLSRIHPCVGQNVSSLLYHMGQHQPSEYAMLVGFPLLLTIGLITNTLYVIFVLSGQKESTKTVYLTVLAISGSFLLLFEVPRFVHVSLPTAAVRPHFASFMTHSVGLQLFGECSFMLISNWIIVISNPVRFHRGVRKKYAVIVITIITAIALGLSIASTYLYYKSIWGTGLMDDNLCIAKSYRLELGEVLSLSKMLFFMQGLFATVLVPLITFIFMIISTTILLILLVRARARKKDLQNGQKVDIRWSAQLSSDGTRALLRTLAGYFITQAPRVVFLSYRATSALRNCYALLAINMLMQNRAAPVIHVLFLVNYAVTFLYHSNLIKDFKKRWRERKEKNKTKT
ncbi:uncharacterized protein LOC129587174 isoform X2 [Paramacrobiotus metropolitanus]|uniref:uncharacterized protein LOC129587174 isoform X2 n=1 Tax=Paramacrobiotus metropolitanus TaxID=2943436 RepID=UPI002445E7B7|nr:uncharacterized protein LOC129587174 isoform X2 [Paramacrobiotus metropolitanus]